MNHSATIEKLCALRNRGSKFGIDRMRLLSVAIGAPQNNFASIHLAGTNGKGSTAAMIEAVLRARGMRVGLYTSPHLVKLGERIQINRKPLEDAQICDYAEELYVAAKFAGTPDDEDYPSFFEMMTAMAFLHFAREKCDVAIIETGLGGRLDATNILAPAVCAITSIGLDHCEMLGETLAEIAAEKAGIIKPNTPVVMGDVPEIAASVIQKRAGEIGAPLISVREVFGENIENYPKTTLFGAHQRRNAATAQCVCESFLHEKIDAIPPVEWAARWEKRRLADGRELILDVAHNAECAGALDALLAENFEKTRKRPLVITGILGIERARPIISVLARHARKIIFVRPAQERACSLEALRTCVPADFRGEIMDSSVLEIFPEAGVCALKTPCGEPILVTGSCYLAGEVLAALAGTPQKNQNFLQDKLPKKIFPNFL